MNKIQSEFYDFLASVGAVALTIMSLYLVVDSVAYSIRVALYVVSLLILILSLPGILTFIGSLAEDFSASTFSNIVDVLIGTSVFSMKYMKEKKALKEADRGDKILETISAETEKLKTLDRQEQEDLLNQLEQLKTELAKDKDADQSFLMRRLQYIARIVPDFMVTLSMITSISTLEILVTAISDKIKDLWSDEERI